MLGGYATHDDRVNANQEKKACIELPFRRQVTAGGGTWNLASSTF